MSNGMKELAEQKNKAIACVCCCGVMTLAMSATWCGLYWSMWTEAGEFNDDAAKVGYKNDSIDAYDTCGDFAGETNTQWSVILAFNAILYLVLSICTVLLIIGSVFPPLLCCGCLGHTFGGCGMLACVIVTGVFRYQSEGKNCADNGVDLFKDHGKMIQDLFISQCVLYCVYGCFVGFMLQLSIMAGGLSFATFLARNQS